MKIGIYNEESEESGENENLCYTNLNISVAK